MRSVDSEASSAGLTTSVLPMASAAPSDARQDLHGIVPGNDAGHDAVRLAQRQRGIAVEEGNGVAVDLVAGAAVELEIAQHGRDIGLALPERLAGVARFERGEFGASASTSRPSRVSSRPRSTAGIRPHGPSSKARRAASTARPTSASPEAGIEAKARPSEGQTTSIRLAGERIFRPAADPSACQRRPSAPASKVERSIADISLKSAMPGFYCRTLAGDNPGCEQGQSRPPHLSSDAMRQLAAGLFKSIRI